MEHQSGSGLHAALDLFQEQVQRRVSESVSILKPLTDLLNIVFVCLSRLLLQGTILFLFCCEMTWSVLALVATYNQLLESAPDSLKALGISMRESRH